MGHYEYHEFITVDRPLTQAQKEMVESLSSRADVTDWSASFEYNYSSFRGDPENLLVTTFDAMIYVSNWGLKLAFAFPVEQFDTSRAVPYRVKCFDYEDEGVQIKTIGKRVLLWVSLSELELGWVDGEGWLDRMLPLREALLNGDDRPLYLFWLAVFSNGFCDPEDSDTEELVEPPVPPGMGELDDAHQVFATRFEISDGLLVAAAKKSEEIKKVSEKQVKRVIEELKEEEWQTLLFDVWRGEHVTVRRQLNNRARALLGDVNISNFSKRPLQELEKVARKSEEEMKLKARADYLDELEANKEKLWNEINDLVSRNHPRYGRPVDILTRLHDLAQTRGGLDSFTKRVKKLRCYGNSPSFMKKLKEKGLLEQQF